MSCRVIFSTKMKNCCSQSETLFEENFKGKGSLLVEHFFHFGSENGEEHLKKTENTLYKGQ